MSSNERQIGNNVGAHVNGNILTLTIDLSMDLGDSKSGKTRMVATTNGNVTLPDGTRLGLNAYRYKE